MLQSGKGALGTWRALDRSGHRARDNDSIKDGPSLTGKPLEEGADMGQHLSFTSDGKAVRVKATVRTGFGKSDLPGVCPAKADTFSGSQSHLGRSQKPSS